MNKHDRGMALIAACIHGGANTLPQIIGMMMRLDFNRGHVAILLNESAGTNAAVSWWSIDKNGIYKLLAS